MFERRPAYPHRIGGILVTPRDKVLVCAYRVHRHPAHWQEPTSFQPQRWEHSSAHQTSVAFGWGPHACAGAVVAAELVELLLRIITDGYQIEFTRTALNLRWAQRWRRPSRYD